MPVRRFLQALLQNCCSHWWPFPIGCDDVEDLPDGCNAALRNDLESDGRSDLNEPEARRFVLHLDQLIDNNAIVVPNRPRICLIASPTFLPWWLLLNVVTLEAAIWSWARYAMWWFATLLGHVHQRVDFFVTSEVKRMCWRAARQSPLCIHASFIKPWSSQPWLPQPRSSQPRPSALRAHNSSTMKLIKSKFWNAIESKYFKETRQQMVKVIRKETLQYGHAYV